MNIALGWQKIEDDVRLVLDNRVEKSVVHTVGVLSWAKNASVRVELQRSVVFAAKTAFQFHHRLISLTNAAHTCIRYETIRDVIVRPLSTVEYTSVASLFH